MGLFRKLKKRRVIPWLGAYLGGGFLALEGVDQLVGYGLLPELAYRIVLVLYLFGIPGTIIRAWFHGERGQQRLESAEIWLGSVLVLGAVVTTALVVRDYRIEQASRIDLAERLGLDPRGVAVLYFEDPDGEYGFAADGLTEALIDRLSTVRALDVVSRDGVAPFRDSELPVDSIARILDVRTVITGSIEGRGDRVRVTARLTDGLTGADVQRDAFEVPPEELLAAQDSLATTISQFLRARLGQEFRLRESRRGTDVLEAWSLVQRAEGLRRAAREAEDRDDPGSALTALAAADSTLARSELADPDWIEPIVLRANTAFVMAYLQATAMHDLEGSEAITRTGLEHAARALARFPGDPRALEARGTLRYFLWLLDVSEDATQAERLIGEAAADLERAVEVDPTLASAWATLSHLRGNRANNAGVALAARRAYEEDAFLRDVDLILERLFWAHFDLQQFNDARTWCEVGRARFETNHRFIECGLWLMLAPSERADPDSAWALRDRLVSLAPEGAKPMAERLGHLLVAGVLRRAGSRDSAQAVFARGRGDDVVDPFQRLVIEEARIRSATGDPDGAMDLVRLYVAANPGHRFEEGGQLHWMWHPLREHPDFASVIQRN